MIFAGTGILKIDSLVAVLGKGAFLSSEVAKFEGTLE